MNGKIPFVLSSIVFAFLLLIAGLGYISEWFSNFYESRILNFNEPLTVLIVAMFAAVIIALVVRSWLVLLSLALALLAWSVFYLQSQYEDFISYVQSPDFSFRGFDGVSLIGFILVAILILFGMTRLVLFLSRRGDKAEEAAPPRAKTASSKTYKSDPDGIDWKLASRTCLPIMLVIALVVAVVFLASQPNIQIPLLNGSIELLSGNGSEAEEPADEPTEVEIQPSEQPTLVPTLVPQPTNDLLSPDSSGGVG